MYREVFETNSRPTIKMDKNHNYQTRHLHHHLNSSATYHNNVNRLKLFSLLVSLFILNTVTLIGASYHGQPQQAPPTSLTIKNNQKYNTTYACEGSQLTINCDQPGNEINVIRSNFGRFSISICNAQGVLDWSVNCFSKNTVELIRRACNGQRQCLLQASTELFGNPCPSTYKYLEVHYECTNKEQQQNVNSPLDMLTSSNLPKPIFSASINVNSPNSVNTNNVNSHHNNQISSRENNSNKRNSAPPPSIIIPDNPLLKHHSTANKQPSIPLVPIYHTTPSSMINNLFKNQQQPSRQPPDNEDLFFDNKQNNDNSRSTSYSADAEQQRNSSSASTSPSSTNRHHVPQFCPNVFERGLNWNRTEVESYVTQPCPAGSTGIAQWFCSPPTNNPNDLPSNANEPHWVPVQPIFAQCQSTWLTQITKRMTNGESALLLSEELSNMIAETNQLYGGDVRGITELLRLLLQPLELMIAQHHQQEQTKIAKEMLASIETICSTLLEDVYRQSWYELSPTNRKTAASLLLSALQRNSILYSGSITDNHHDYVKLHSNLYMAIHILPTSKLLQSELQGDKQSDLVLPLNVIETGQQSSSTQPAIDNQFNLLLQNQFNGNSISIPTDTLLRYATNGQVCIVFMMFKKLDTILEPELLRESDEYSVNKFGQNVTQMLNSDILSISLNEGNPPLINNPSLYGSLQPLTLTLRHLSTNNVSNPRCVHWNNELRNWSDQGCVLLESNQTHSKCNCKHHLTNFALLMDIQEGSIAQSNYASNDKSSKLNELYPSLNGLDEKSGANGDSQFLLNQWRHYSRPGATLLVFIVIGSIVSIIFLAITLASLCCLVVKRNLLATVFEQCKLENIPLVQKNLTFNLLAKQLVFLILICSSSYVTDKKCNIYYALLLIAFYYLLLSTFSWLFFTCYELYCVVCSKCMEFNTMLAAHSHAHAAGTLQSTNNLNSLHCSPANSATSSNGTGSGSTTTTTMLSNGQLATTTTTTLNNDNNSNSTLNTISQESQRRHRRLIYQLVPILLPVALISFVYWISKVQLIGALNQMNICSFESRVHFAALILITALFTLAVNLLFVLCTWRKIRYRSSSANDLLQPNLMLLTNGQNPASLPDFTLMNSMKSDPLELNGLPRFSPFTKKERLALFSSLTGTLLIIINSTLMILYLTHQFTFVGYLLTLTNTLIGLHLFLCCCLSRSRIRCKYGEILGKFKRRLVCHRQSNKSNFLDSQLFNASTLISPAVQLHSRNATLKQQQANAVNNNILDNPLISSAQLSSSKYFLNGNVVSSDLTDTGSDYGCKRLQQQMHVANGMSPANYNQQQQLQQQSNGGSIIVNMNNNASLQAAQQHHNSSSNQHLYHLYTAKQGGCQNPYNCHHGIVEHVYESIDDEPNYVAKLLMSQQQAAAQLAALRNNNSRTLGFRTANSQQHVQQQLQYLQQQQHFRSSNSSTTSNNNSSIATNGSLIDRPLIPSSLSASTNYLNNINATHHLNNNNNNNNNMNNKRLALLPAIVKDTNNGKTTIICGENDLRDVMHQQQPDIQQTFNHQYIKQNLVTVLNGNNKIVTSSSNATNDQGINI